MNYYVFPKFSGNLANKEIDLDTDTIVLLLLTSTYAYDRTNEFISDLTNEVTGGGYARKTVTTSISVADDIVTVNITNSPFLFANIIGTVKWLVFAADLGADAASPLISCVDLDTDAQSLAGQSVSFAVTKVVDFIH